jgi:hypothetical protein
MPMTAIDELPLQPVDAPRLRSDWQQLEQYLERHRMSPLEGWKRIYEEWRAAYEYFRALEQQSLYVSDNDARPVTPDAELLHFHGKLLRRLLDSGEHSWIFLTSLTVDQAEEMERMEYNSRLSTLLEALRESLILWHSDEPPSSGDIRRVFSNAAV